MVCDCGHSWVIFLLFLSKENECTFGMCVCVYVCVLGVGEVCERGGGERRGGEGNNCLK